MKLNSVLSLVKLNIWVVINEQEEQRNDDVAGKAETRKLQAESKVNTSREVHNLILLR